MYKTHSSAWQNNPQILLLSLSPIVCTLLTQTLYGNGNSQNLFNISPFSLYYEIDSIWKLQYQVFSCTTLNFSHMITIRLKMIQTSHNNLLSPSLVHAAIEYISQPPLPSFYCTFHQSAIKTQLLLWIVLLICSNCVCRISANFNERFEFKGFSWANSYKLSVN